MSSREREAGNKGVLKFLEEKGIVFLYLGAAAILAGGVWYAIGRTLDAWVQWLLVGGLISLGVYALVRPQDLQSVLRGRAVRYGSNVLILSLAVTGIVVLVNYLSNRYYKRFDLTEIGRHTLSEQSIQVLKGLEQPIEVIGFYPQGRNKDDFESWLDIYRAHTDKLVYQAIDPILEPGRAEQYEWSGYGGGLIVRRGERQQQVYTADEQDITSALLRVSRDEQKAVYFLTGHNERQPTDYGQSGYGTISELLVQNNYRVESLNLAVTSTVPLDAALVVVAGPETTLLEGEADRLRAYLQAGGKALIMLDPGSPADLDALLAPWGVRFEQSLVVDAQMALGGDPTAPVIDRYRYGEMTKDLPMIVLPYARPIVQDAAVEDVVWTSLGESSAQSWAKTDLEALRTSAQLQYVEGQDRLGPLTLLATVEGPGEGDERTRLVLVGDADLAANGVLAEIPNGQYLVLNAVNWLAEEEALIAIPPKANVPRSLYLTTVQQGAVCFGTLIFIPAVILIAGLSVWLRMRKPRRGEASNSPSLANSESLTNPKDLR